MKRFAKAYLTIVLIVAVVVNLVLVVIYGQHFLFQGAEVCDSATAVCENGFKQGVLTTQLVIVNGVISGIFGLSWLILRRAQNIFQG